MKIEQRIWSAGNGWGDSAGPMLKGHSDLVLVFGSPAALRDPAAYKGLRDQHPRAHILGCSTAGEIHGPQIADDSLAVTAIDFEQTEIRCARAAIRGRDGSFTAGRQLAEALPEAGLVHVLVLSDGLNVNGTELTSGLVTALPKNVAVTGGLAADGARFEQTSVMLDGEPCQNMAVAVGFYGKHLEVGFGSVGGWEPFGPERLVTRSKGNILFELDGRSALELYEHYLGEYASQLPASGLLFPLSIRTDDPTRGLVRTILGIDHSGHSMIFAGDIPEGSYARLMKASADRLVQGAGAAAEACLSCLESPPQLALLISCVGRRLVLKQRTEEELEAVQKVFGQGTALAGFYSYGEIAPFSRNERPELHNQTMTITGFSES